MLSGLKRCQVPSHTSDRPMTSRSSPELSSYPYAHTNIMFELFLAPVCTADLTKQVHRRETVGLTRLPARFMPFILRAFSLFVSPLVEGNLAQALTATPTCGARLQAAAS